MNGSLSHSGGCSRLRGRSGRRAATERQIALRYKPARRPDEATSPMRSRGCLLAGLVVRSAWALARSLITLSKPPSGAGAVRVVREADARGLRPEAEYCGKRCRQASSRFGLAVKRSAEPAPAIATRRGSIEARTSFDRDGCWPAAELGRSVPRRPSPPPPLPAPRRAPRRRRPAGAGDDQGTPASLFSAIPALRGARCRATVE